MNRKLSSWLRGKLQDRVAFKALAEGFRHEQVNPAYGSQSCPFCEFVDSRNRKGDRFQCLHCGHEDVSDRIAAQNYAIPRAVRKLEFGQRESSRGSIDRKEVSINAIRASLRSSNPGALAQSKFQFVNGSGYRRFGDPKDQGVYALPRSKNHSFRQVP